MGVSAGYCSSTSKRYWMLMKHGFYFNKVDKSILDRKEEEVQQLAGMKRSFMTTIKETHLKFLGHINSKKIESKRS